MTARPSVPVCWCGHKEDDHDKYGCAPCRERAEHHFTPPSSSASENDQSLCEICGFPPYLAPGVLHVCEPPHNDDQEVGR